MVVDTEDGHRVMLRPRHANYMIGSGDEHGITCYFFWDGEYIALANLREHSDGDVTIRPQDYSWSDDHQHVPDRP